MPTSTQAPWSSDYDMYLLEEGTHCRAYEKMGAHLGELAGQPGGHLGANGGGYAIIRESRVPVLSV